MIDVTSVVWRRWWDANDGWRRWWDSQLRRRRRSCRSNDTGWTRRNGDDIRRRRREWSLAVLGGSVNDNWRWRRCLTVLRSGNNS